MILEIKDVHKSFSGTEVLHGVSFTITSGKALGFLGRNGAGKTTTIRILMGLFDANKGEILLDGKKFNPIHHSIGYLPEERGLYPKQKILDQLIYFGELRGLSKKESRENSLYWLEKLGVSEYKDKKLETLSKGNQQKIQIVETLICNPDIIVLDEPFSGLDPVNSQILKDVINELIEKGKLVIFSSHQMSYVEEFCEEIALIDKGNIVLTGNLKSIKREYGRNRMILSSSNLSLEEVHKLLSSKVDGIKTPEIKKGHLLIELMNGKSKKDFLNDLISLDIDVEKFAIYEPTLTDIFVEKVGDK